MTLQSHPNSSPQRQWLWRWELTVTHFPPFPLQTLLSWFPSTEGCPADASGQTAVQSRHVSSSAGDLETGQYCETVSSLSPSLASPGPAVPTPLCSDCTLCLWILLAAFSISGVSPGCSWVWWWVTVAQRFRHWLPPVSVTANYSSIAQRCLNEKLLLELKRQKYLSASYSPSHCSKVNRGALKVQEQEQSCSFYPPYSLSGNCDFRLKSFAFNACILLWAALKSTGVLLDPSCFSVFHHLSLLWSGFAARALLVTFQL